VGAGLTNSFRQVMFGSYLNPRHLLRCLAVGLSVGAPDNFPKDPGHTGEAASRTYPLGGFVRNRMFVMVRKSRWSFKDDRRLMELARASTSLEQVVEITGKSPEAIKRAAMRLGISFKSQAKKK
jgi:hypothetical protein